jgi:ABC-type glutathione transport system ATPase component
MTKPLISVKDLTLSFRTDEGLVTAVNNVSFDIAPGEVLGLVGESGSGKSDLYRAMAVGSRSEMPFRRVLQPGIRSKIDPKNG